jgi:putative transposase
VKRLCQLGRVSRSGFYRWGRQKPSADGDLQVRDALQRIALEFPSYGWPRMARELRRRGWAVNHKRVYPMMREDNLLCLRRQKFVSTTDSAHALPVYPNLARAMTPTRVIGWALERTLEVTLTIEALRMALEQRRPAPGLVHHSDRGVQYASRDYTALLQAQGITISMLRKANPYDNARAESFVKTLKYEEVYRDDYQDLPQARASIRRFLEQVYNEKRLHSSLGYLPPVEFEQALAASDPRKRWEMACPAPRFAI